MLRIFLFLFVLSSFLFSCKSHKKATLEECTTQTTVHSRAVAASSVRTTDTLSHSLSFEFDSIIINSDISDLQGLIAHEAQDGRNSDLKNSRQIKIYGGKISSSGLSSATREEETVRAGEMLSTEFENSGSETVEEEKPATRHSTVALILALAALGSIIIFYYRKIIKNYY